MQFSLLLAITSLVLTQIWVLNPEKLQLTTSESHFFSLESASSDTDAIAQAQNANQLTQTQKNLLKSLGIKIAAPTYVPAGFKLRLVQAELSGSRVGDIRYSLIYERYDANAGKDFCFAIEGTNGGVGGLPNGDRSYPVNSRSLGRSTLEYGKYGQAANPTLLGEWLGKGPFYRFVGAGVTPNLSRCENISPQEAVKVSESLQYLP